MMRRWQMAAGCLCLVVALPLASQAQETKANTVSAVVVPAAGMRANERINLQKQLFSSALRHSHSSGPWQLLIFAPGPDEQSEAEQLTEVAGVIEKGKNQYRYLQLEEAGKSFAQAQAMLENSPPAGCNRKQIADLYLYWARTTLDMGDEAEARRLLQQIPRFDPAAAPDPATMPPTLVATFDIALEDYRAKGESSLILGCGPAQARITADCVEQPTGVVEVKGREGQSLWLAAESGGTVARLKVDMEKGERRSLFIFAPRMGEEKLLRQALYDLREGVSPLENLKVAKSPALDKLAAHLEVDLLQVAEVRDKGAERVLRIGLYVPGHGLQGSIYEVALDLSFNLDSIALASAQLDMASTAVSPTLLARLAKPQPTVGEVAKPPEKEEEEESAAWYKSWWFWTAVGVLVAGGVAGGVAAALTAGDSPSGKVIITVGQPH